MNSFSTSSSSSSASSISPFTIEQIQEWISFGPQVKPSTEKDIEMLRERKIKVWAMKKRLAKELKQQQQQQQQNKQNGDDKGSFVWSERYIEKELDRLANEHKIQNDISDDKDGGGNKENNHDPTKTKSMIRPAYQLDNSHPDNTMDHRSKGGPLLEYLWCQSPKNMEQQQGPPLQGQTLYLGGEVATNGKIYCIPGHAPRVLVIDDAKKQIYTIGPDLISNGRLYKWLRGIVVNNIIYGLPCHADEILRIDTKTETISKIPIPYEEFYNNNNNNNFHYDDDGDDNNNNNNRNIAKEQREMNWKYHGGSICPIDSCIYAIPQAALHVLKFDPKTEKISFVGPPLPGKYKWYGGIIGKQDGAIYGIPQNAPGVLRIHPIDGITLHGDFGTNNHKWHGGAAATDTGIIVSVPANADNVLCVTPGKVPKLDIIGDSTIIRSGRHRNDGKYKYLGAMCGTNSKVYIFPCASEYVLEVDTEKMIAKNVGPNLRDSGMETVYQNKWQNGLTCVQDKCVYGITLSGHTLLRIDCSKNNDKDNNDDTDPEITTWLLPPPRRECRDKFEGGVITDSGVMYTVPNNHKGVLRIEPACLSSDKMQ